MTFAVEVRCIDMPAYAKSRPSYCPSFAFFCKTQTVTIYATPRLRILISGGA